VQFLQAIEVLQMDAISAGASSKPHTCNGDLAALPAALLPLCEKPNWLIFRWVQKGSDKWTKPPFQSLCPSRMARNNSCETWSSHAAAVEAVKAGEGDGIGFALTGTDFAAIDLDHCRDTATGEIDEWAQAIIDKAPGAYCEITVSGTGLRLIGTGAGETTHTSYKVEEGWEGAKIEIFRRAVRYITVSGLQIGDRSELTNIDNLIDGLIGQYGNAKPKCIPGQGNFELGKRGINDLLRNGVPERQRSEAFQSVVFRLANAGLSIDEIEKVLAKYPNGISKKYATRLRAEIGRSHGKWATSAPADADGADGVGGASTPGNLYNWEDPDFSLLDDRRGELPEFPIEILSGKWQELVQLAARRAGVTPAHVAVPLIAIASGLIGAARRVQASRSWSQPMTIWAALVGASGTGKTPGIDVTKRALTFIDRIRKTEIAKLALEHQTQTEAASAERKLWKKEVEEATGAGLSPPPMPASAVDPGEFVPPKLYVSDATVERMAVLLQSNPRGILRLSDELSALFLNMSRYSGGQDNEFWLEAWNGNSYLVERMGRPPITVEHLLVGVVGGLQPDKLSRSFVGDQDGMYARICFSWPSEPPYRPLSDDVAEIEPEVVNALLRLIKLPCEGDAFGKMVPLSVAGRDRFEQLRQFLHAGRDALDGREREWWSKVQANILRLAGTLCFLDWAIKDDGSPEPQCVDELFVSAAAHLACEYFWPHSRAALRQIGLSERHASLRRALRWMKATGSTEVSIKDIRRDAMAGSLDAEATLDLVERLVNSGWLLAAPVKPSGPKGGKPVRRWRINPLLRAAETAETAETQCHSSGRGGEI
jgi:hypothetical protein